MILQILFKELAREIVDLIGLFWKLEENELIKRKK